MGRLVIYLGAAFLTYMVVPFGVIALRDTLKMGFLYFRFYYLTITLAWLLSPALVIWCDAALVLEAVRERRTRQACQPEAMKP